MSADYVRRAGLGVNLRTMSTPNIALQRKQFEDSDLAGRAGSCTVPQSGPRYSPQRRRPATAAGDFVPLLDSSVRRQRGSWSRSSRRRSRSRRSSGASSAGSLLKPPDITAQESVLLRQLDRIKELRAGVDKDAGTQWTPRGQHVRPRSRCETQQQPGEEASQRLEAGLQNQMRELHERTLQLEGVVDDKIARRDAWLDLWSTELNDLGWSRPEKERRRALHGGSRPGVVTDMPAMPGLEVPRRPARPPNELPLAVAHLPCSLLLQMQDGKWQRARAGSTPGGEVAGAGPQAQGEQEPRTASGGGARRHPQHATVGRRAGAGLSIPHRSGRFQQVAQGRQAYAQALQAVAELEVEARREELRDRARASAVNGLSLTDTRNGG